MWVQRCKMLRKRWGTRWPLSGELAMGGEVGAQNQGHSVPGRFGTHVPVLSERHVGQRGGCGLWDTPSELRLCRQSVL